jgi:RNA polymerase sigma factor (sigma-70 family)
MELIDLVNAARVGDKAAFGAIVRRFQDMAYGGAYAWLGESEDARDAAQDAFIDAWESLDQLRDPIAFPGWFRRIVIKHADRHKRRRRAALDIEEARIATGLPDALQLAEQQDMRQTVRAAVGRLPESQRLPLTLFHLDGLSQKEVAAFLELPVSTVKKRIFDARKLLEGRLSQMAKQELQDTRPSRDDGFALRVDFFVALREGDVQAVARLLDADPSLLSLRKSYEFSSDEAIPRNLDAATWAAMTDNVSLLTLLLDRGAPAEPEQGEAILQSAVLAGGHRAMRLLLERGASADGTTGNLTPLHYAVMRNDRMAVDILLDAGAKLDARDHRGRTAVDWAALKGRQEMLDHLVQRGASEPGLPVRPPRLSKPLAVEREAPAGEGALQRVFDARGDCLDGGPIVACGKLTATVAQPITPILETGIKAIDLFSPLKRGGLNAFSAGTGVGTAVVVPQIARNLAAELEARIVFVAAQTLDPLLMLREWKSMLTDGTLLGERSTHVLAKLGDAGAFGEAAETGFAMADTFRQEGHEVLLLLDNRVASAPGVHRFLRTCTSTTPQAAVTTLCLASVPFGPAASDSRSYDAVIRLDGTRSRDGLYPAVSPVLSTSTCLTDGLLDEEHRQVVAQARELLRRYYENAQQPQKEVAGPVPKSGSLWHTDAATEDEEETWRLMLRGRRLDLFLTQPFHGMEMWTHEPGEVVPVQEAVAGCRRIMIGEFDDVPEVALRMIGTIDQSAEKASRR